jgi:hypothetical protein
MNVYRNLTVEALGEQQLSKLNSCRNNIKNILEKCVMRMCTKSWYDPLTDTDVVHLGSVLQARRSWVQFSIRSLDFLVDLILPDALWTWGRLSL